MKNILKLTLLLNVLLFFNANIYSQAKKGCTDPNAKNYDSTAVINDGSCEYRLTIYNPKLKLYLPKEVEETSGLAFFNGGLWTMNDSGGKPVLYKTDTTNGKITQRITIENAVNRDWEDLATDDKFVYIGDFGNNSGNRDDLKIYKVKKSDIPEKGNAKVKAKIISFKFADRGNNKIKSRKENNFDCEAFTVIGDSLYLFSKNWENQKTRLYVLPKKAGNYVAQLRGSFDTKGLVTAADYNAQKNELVLQGYKNRSWIPFLWIFYDFPGANVFDGNKRRIIMPQIIATQTESIVFTDNSGHVFITSEATKIGKQSLYSLNTEKWTLEKPVAKATPEIKINSIIAKSHSSFKVYLNKIPNGEYEAEVYDMVGNKIAVKKLKLKKKEDKIYLQIKTPQLNKGVYFVKVTAGASKTSKSFTVK